MPDYGAKMADRAIKTVERKIRRTYRTAQKELQEKLSEFVIKHQAKEKTMLDKVKKGLITEQDFKNWQTGQLFMEKQWKDKLDQVTRILFNANQEAAKVVHEQKLDVFAENYNHEAFELTKKIGSDVGFNTYNTESVAKFVTKKPDVLPKWKIHEKKDYVWNYNKAKNAVTQGIIQGEGIEQITDRLVSTLCTQNEDKMRMFARTAITGAQNAGRIEQMHDAEELGIKLKKRWVATLDSRTRDLHQRLDGQEVPIDEPFKIDDYEINFPGDPSAEPEMVYNCRCTMIQVYEGIDRKSIRRDEDDNAVEDMTYSEWKEAKENGTLKTDKKLVEEPIKSEKNEQKEYTGVVEDMRDKLKEYSEQMETHMKKMNELDEEYKKLYTESLTKYGTDEYDGITKRMEEIHKDLQIERNEEIKIQTEKEEYLKTNGEDEIATAFGKINKDHGIEDDVIAVNKITDDERTQKNCGSCCLAYDARRRGIDCQAELTYGVNNNELEAWWKDLKMHSVSSYYPSDAKKEIEEIAESWGNGSRGIVEIDHTLTTGHYMMFEVRNNRCIFLDGQSGVMYSDVAFDAAIPGGIRYGRTDDKELTKRAFLYLRSGEVGKD